MQTRINEIDQQLVVLPDSSAQRSSLEAQRAYLVEQLGRLEVSANLANAGGAVVLAEAAVPSAPVTPKPLRNGLIGAVLFKVGQDWIAAVTPQYWQFWLGLLLVVLVLIGNARFGRWSAALRRTLANRGPSALMRRRPQAPVMTR